MASKSEMDFMVKYGPYKDSRVLLIGSSHPFTDEMQKAGNPKELVRLDMQPHKCTDIVHNMNDPLEIEPFDAIWCFSVLEHCDKPWLVAPNITNVLKPGGLLLISVPFWWRVHGYPSDYWRFTPAAVRVLFPEDQYEWLEESTSPPKTDLGTHTAKAVHLLHAGRKK